MDMLQADITDARNQASRNLYYGPRTVPSSGYGISIDLSYGWLASVEQGELFGIQSLFNDSDRIYVEHQKTSLIELKLASACIIELGRLKLQPCSDLVINRNQVSRYYKVNPHAVFTDAFVLSASVQNGKSIVFTTLCDESALQIYKDTVLQIASTIKSI